MNSNPKEEYYFESLLEEEEEIVDETVSLKDSYKFLTSFLIILTAIFVFSITSGLMRLIYTTIYLIISFIILKFGEKRFKGKLLFALSSTVVVVLTVLYSMFSAGTLYLPEDVEMEVGMKMKLELFDPQDDILQKLIMKSSNSEVIAFEGNEIVAKNEGEATLTFSDIFGHEMQVNYKVKDTKVSSFNIAYFSEITVAEEVWIDVQTVPFSYKKLDYTLEIIEGSEFGEIEDVEVDGTSNYSNKVKVLRGLKKGNMKLRVSTKDYGYKDIFVKVSNGIGNFLLSPMVDTPSSGTGSDMKPFLLEYPQNVTIQTVYTVPIDKEDLSCSANGKKIDSFDNNAFFEVFVESKTEVVCTHDNKISNVLILDVGGQYYER